MANADITAIVTGDTKLLDEALNRVVSKPRSLKLSIDNSSSGALGRIRAELGEFSRSLAASNARVLAFGASAGAMYAVGRSIKELVNSTVQVEKRLTSINSILGASRSEFGRFGNELFRIAQETSSSFDDVADAAEELARQGVGIEETLKRTSSAMKLVRISGVSAVTAVEAMTAALNTNNDVLLTSESLINKLAAVDAKFAVSAAGLTEALKRVGSVAVDAGFSIDELIAAVTSAQQTTARGEAVIGNSLKTIFTRAQRPKVLEDFQSLGIETKNAVGNIRPLKDILIEVAKQYDNLSSAQQSNISELVGGVYQINILKALFRDLGKETSIFGRAFEESFGATDQASQRVAQLNETLDALFKRFSVNLTKFGSQSGNAAFAPLGKSLLKGMNTVLEGVTSELGDKNDVSGRIMEGLFKGLGNALSGPLLVGGLAVLIKLLRDWRVQGMDAIKTLSGLNRSFHSLEIVTSSVGNFLREHPNHLLAISTASKTAEGSTRALAAATADYVKWATQKAEVDQLIGRTSGIVARGAVAQGVFSAPVAGRGETLQVRRASAGLLPEISEKIGAYAGGYKPGQVRDMNVPGMGRIYYNTAEKVKWFPGMAQPAIMPPQSSRAGRNYEQNFAQTHGFNPYMAGGMIPNFAANPELQKAFTERFYRAKRSLTPHDQKFEKGGLSKRGLDIGELGVGGDLPFKGISYLPETPTTVSGSISAITRRAPDEVTKRQLLRLAREFDHAVSDKAFKEDKSFLFSATYAADQKNKIKSFEQKLKDNKKDTLVDFYNGVIKSYQGSRENNVRSYLEYRKARKNLKSLSSSDYLFRGVSLDEITNLRRLGQVTSLGTANADEKLGTFITSSFGKAAGFGAATLKESGQGYVLALDKKRILSRPTAESMFGSEEKNTIKAGRIEKDDVLGVVDLKTRQLRSLEEFAAKNEEIKRKLRVRTEEMGVRYSPVRFSRHDTKFKIQSSTGVKGTDDSKTFFKLIRGLFGTGKAATIIKEAVNNPDSVIYESGKIKELDILSPEKQKIERLKSILSKPDSEILSAGRYSMARGLVPNFSKDIFHSSSAGNALISTYGKTAEILGIATNQEGSGGSKKIYRDIFEKIKGKGIKIVTGKLQRQDRYPNDDSDISAVKAMLPQVTRARFGKYSILGVGNTEVRLNAKTFDADLAKNAALIRSQMDTGSLPFLSTYLSNGLVPNFALTKKGNRYYGQYHSSHRSLYLDGLLNGKDFQVDMLRKSGKGGALDFFADRIKTDFSQLGVESVSFTPDNSDGRAHIRERAFNLFLKKNKIKQGLYRDIFSSGLIPNFSPLSSAIAREAGSVNSSLIRVGSHSSLRGPGNPDGMGVYNLRDEPLGLGQGVERAKSMGLNPKTHGIPNFAFEKQIEWIFGNESSPGREGAFSKALAASFIPTAITSATGTSDSLGGKIATEITDALSLGLTIAAFARGKGGKGLAIGTGLLSGFMGVVKQSTNSFNTLDAEVNDLKNKIQKAGDGMGMYGQTLEQLQNAYLDSSVKTVQIVKLQDKLAQTLAGLPEELRRQLMSAKTLEQVQDIGSRYSEARTSEFQQKELALTLSTNLNSRNFRRGSLIESSEKITEGMGKSKLEGVADIILSALVSSKGLEKIGGAAGLSSGDFFTKLKQGGISGSVTEQLSRVRGSELDVIKSRLIGQAGTRETDMAKIREMMPEKQRFSQQLAALEKQADAARKAIKQTFESIGQMANLRLKMGGRQGIMRATGINEEIQGLGSLMSETSSPDRMAITNYRSQLASNQLKAATETSEVFAELRSGISDLFNQFDLSRMGDIPANVRGGQSKLLNVLGGQNTVGGIGEGAISIFKALGKDEGVNDIKKLMADSNEKLVDIQQTLREGNKIAEIQRNIAIQRAEFDRSLKTGGGLSSFLDRGDKYGKMSDIYGAQFGYQSGIFKGQGAIELVRSYLGAGGKATDSGVSGLLGTAKEERALDIIETQKDLNRAFAGSGLKLGVPNISEARKLAETQIAAELKTGDSDMERQMAGLERALQSAISSSFGGQMSDAAQVFANVLAGSDTFRLLNSTLEKNTQVLAGLESSLKGMKGGLTTDIISSARAGGNIPMAAAGYEKMMAKAGGYNPGNVRRAGNLIYNSAERVDYLPGIREPVISPPPGSLAGFLHRQNFRGLGFAASGSLFEGFSLDDIKYESSKSTRDISHPTGYKTEPISGSSKIIDFSGRKIVIVDKGGVKIPFYLSSGQAGKDKGVGVAGSVPKGKWYPFFGIDPNEGWLNKMGGEPMSSHYNSSQLKAIADELDSKLGNINSEGKLFSQVQKETLMKLKVPLVDRVGNLTHANEAVVPKVGVRAYPSKEIASHIKQINMGLSPTQNELPDTRAKLQANIDKIKSKLAGQSASSPVSTPSSSATKPVPLSSNPVPRPIEPPSVNAQAISKSGDNFENWKAKQEQLRVSRSERAKSQNRGSAGKFQIRPSISNIPFKPSVGGATPASSNPSISNINPKIASASAKIPFTPNFPPSQSMGGANSGDPYLMNKVRGNPFAIAPTGLPPALPRVPSNFRTQTAIPSAGMTMPSIRPIGLPISPAPRKPSPLGMAPTPITGINFSNELNIGHGEYYNLGSDARAYDSPGMTPMELEKTQRGNGGSVVQRAPLASLRSEYENLLRSRPELSSDAALKLATKNVEESSREVFYQGGKRGAQRGLLTSNKPWQPYYKTPQLVKDSIGPTLPGQARAPRVIEEFQKIKKSQGTTEFWKQYQIAQGQGANGQQALEQAQKALASKGFNAPNRLYGGGLPGQAYAQRNFRTDVGHLLPKTNLIQNTSAAVKNVLASEKGQNFRLTPSTSQGFNWGQFKDSLKTGAGWKNLGKGLAKGAGIGVATGMALEFATGSKGIFDEQKYSELLNSDEYKNAKNEEERKNILRKSYITGKDMMEDNEIGHRSGRGKVNVGNALSWAGRALSFVPGAGQIWDVSKNLAGLTVEAEMYKGGVLESQSEADLAEQKFQWSENKHRARKEQKAIMTQAQIAQKAYQSTSGTRFQQEQFGTMQDMSAEDRVKYYRGLMTPAVDPALDAKENELHIKALLANKPGNEANYKKAQEELELFKKNKPATAYKLNPKVGQYETGERDSALSPDQIRQLYGRDIEKRDPELFQRLQVGGSGKTMTETALSNASTEVNRDTLAKRYNITAPGQLDRLHTGLTNAAQLGKTKEYVAQLEKAYKGTVGRQPIAEQPKPETNTEGDKTKLDININMGGNLGLKNTSVEFSEEQYLIINAMIATVSEGIEKKIKAITDKLPAETRSNVANATPPQAGPSRATPYGV